jgi:SAM-dependent methyltransferase
MRLDVGCGELGRSKLDRYRRYGLDPARYCGVDRAPVAGVSLVADLDRPLPIAQSAVEEIVAVHVLEHVLDLGVTMREFHRVLRPGGLLRVWVPHCFSTIAFGDTTHRRFFTFDSLSQFDAHHPAAYYYDFHFEFVMSRLQVFRRWYKPRLLDRLLERVLNRNPRRGERWLKVLPYKEWEVYACLRKPLVDR